MNYKPLPHNIQAEQILLGAFLNNNEYFNKVSDLLQSNYLFEPVHQRIYEAISTCIDKGLIATPVTLKNKFDQDEALRELNGSEYLIKLSSNAMTIIDIMDYAKTIHDLYIRRKLIDIGEQIYNDAFKEDLDIRSIHRIEKAEHNLYKLVNDSLENNKNLQPLKFSIVEAINKVERAYKNKEKVTGLSTGFIDLDKLLGGFHDSDLIILAGRPSMGKTAFAINLAVNAAKYLQNNPFFNESEVPTSVAFFSLEMSSEQLATRILSMNSKVNASKLRNGIMTEEELLNVIKTSKDLYQLPIFLDSTPSITISSLRSQARRLKRQHNIGLIVIDYLQLIRGVARSSEANRVQEISEITQSLKAIAKELNIPVIALSQLSRAVEQREDKKPQLADLRESGSIEQDADIVMFIYREEYYLMRKQPTEGTDRHLKWQEEMNNNMNVADIIIAKHRNGPIGNVSLHFDSTTTKFNNLANSDRQKFD